MTLSQLALEDVEALCFEPSFLMADPMGPLLDQDEEEALSPSSSLEGKAPASPPLSYYSYASSLSPYQTLSSSPPPSPPTHPSSFLGTKAGLDPLSWLDAGSLLDTHVGAEEGKDDAFAGMDWMTEKIDLSEFDLDSLIGSCSSDDSPSSPEELLASLDSQMDLDPGSYDSGVSTSPEGLELGLPLPHVPALPPELAPLVEAEAAELAPDLEVVLKSEPLSPPPPASPMYLEIRSDVDLLDKVATTVTATIIQDPASGRMLLVVANKEEPAPVALPEPAAKPPPASSDSDSDSGIDSPGSSPPRPPSPPPPPPPPSSASSSAPSSPAGSSRTKPYTKPEPGASASKAAPKVKSVSGAPKVVEKKLKKMEQNKTAATRYRQKKRVEQELLSSECDELEKRNQELEEKAESISREIQYLKDLMEEVRKRRTKTSSAA